jgi:hypothetical protein
MLKDHFTVPTHKNILVTIETGHKPTILDGNDDVSEAEAQIENYR